MTIQQTMCANCGKPLSPVWRDRCEHCKAPMSVARPRPERSRSVFRGLTREDAQRQAEADVVTARSNGYELETMEWSDDSGIHVLSVSYRYTGRFVTPPIHVGDGVVQAGGRSRVVAGLLGIFLGGLGIHKFYCGKIAQGVLYLLFFWTFIPAIIGFIEGIWYLTMSDQAFAARYPAA